jgi:hypothetical protein
VRWLDLATGKTTLVARLHGSKHESVNVVANGNNVAWDVAGKQPDGTRSMPNGRVIHLAHRVLGISSDGIVLRSDANADQQYTTWFQPFGNATRLLLSKRGFDEPPQVVNHALAWVSIDGNLKVAQYRY